MKISPFVIFFLSFFLLWSCRTFLPPPRGLPGGIENPIRADMPLGERVYLKSLRTAAGERVEYFYRGAILGSSDQVLDEYLISPHPEKSNCTLSFFDWLRDQFSDSPRCPDSMLIYMDMYHPGYAEQSLVPPGFSIAGEKGNN